MYTLATLYSQGVSEREIGLREARAQLGDLVAKAQYNRKVTIITRNGRPAAMITPVPQHIALRDITVDFIDRSDQRDQAIDNWLEAAAAEGYGFTVVTTYDEGDVLAVVARDDWDGDEWKLGEHMTLRIDRTGSTVEAGEGALLGVVPGPHSPEQHPNAAPSTAKDIRLALDESGKDSGWNWAEAATGQWIDAAEKAGLQVEVVSIEVPDVNYDAAIVEVDDQQYRISVRNDEITAVPHGSKVTLISATSGDIMPERAVELAESDVDWDDLPDDAQAWAAEQGYGEDEAELLYVVPGEVELDGYPTRVVTL